MAEVPSYHEVVVIIDGVRHRISDNYAYQLTCTRTAGWELWWVWEGEERCLGGEYHNNAEFVIEVAGVVVCVGAPAEPEEES
jgi:hypothetical protein